MRLLRRGESTKKLRAIGWLEGDHEFAKGKVSASFVAKLKKLLVYAWQPCIFRGVHQCTICPAVPETLDERGFVVAKPTDPPRGLRNLFLPGKGFLYVAPELIVHYVEKHGYAPPREFVSAVAHSPEMNSTAYIREVRKNGPRSLGNKSINHWTWLARLDARLETKLLLEVNEKTRRRAVLAACEAALAATKVSDPVIDQALAALRRGRKPSASVAREAAKLAEHLYEASFKLSEPDCPRPHPHGGQPCVPAYRRFSAAWAVAFAASNDPLDACAAISTANTVLDRDWKTLRKIVVTAMKEPRSRAR